MNNILVSGTQLFFTIFIKSSITWFKGMITNILSTNKRTKCPLTTYLLNELTKRALFYHTTRYNNSFLKSKCVSVSSLVSTLLYRYTIFCKFTSVISILLFKMASVKWFYCLQMYYLLKISISSYLRETIKGSKHFAVHKICVQPLQNWTQCFPQDKKYKIF